MSRNLRKLPDGSLTREEVNELLDLLESLISDPWISDGHEEMPVEICKFCRHDYSIASSKAHYRDCEWVKAKEWLDDNAAADSAREATQ